MVLSSGKSMLGLRLYLFRFYVGFIYIYICIPSYTLRLQKHTYADTMSNLQQKKTGYISGLITLYLYQYICACICVISMWDLKLMSFYWRFSFEHPNIIEKLLKYMKILINGFSMRRKY